MRLFLLLFVVSLFSYQLLLAEGTHEMAPNGSILVNGNNTTDIAALHINHMDYNRFASYTNADPHSRLYIHILNPSAECIYLGFSFAHPNVTPPPAPPHISYEYRIKDPNGNVVFGPVLIDPGNENITNWSEAFTGPMQLEGAGGYNAINVSSSDLLSQGWSGEGDYYIEFRNATDTDFLIDFWDITVADCSITPEAPKVGRIWSYNWSFFAINDFGFPNRPFNGAFYVCAPDPDDVDAAFITKIDFNGSGFRPAAFNVAFNSFGIQNTGNIIEDRRSVQNANATQSEYAIFLNDPIEICKTAIVGEINLLGISRCNAEDFCIKFTTSKEGRVDLLLDFDGQDSVFTPGTADVIIIQIVTSDEVGIPTCIDWDGLDGLGNPVLENPNIEIPVIISYLQGIYHFPIFDAEYMTQGFMIEAVRPAASIPLLHYDDSNITVPSGSAEPKVQWTGCVNPCHRWTNYNNASNVGYGNLNTINSWWFSQRIVRQDVFFLPEYYTCRIEGPSSLCQGGTTKLVSNPAVVPEGAPGGEIISTVWTGPGIIGSNTGSTITIGSDGLYSTEIHWLNEVGDTCQASCEFNITLDPPFTSSIDTLILLGETVVINGESYTEAGEYIQQLTSVDGCDSILTITVKVLQTVIHYNLNDCVSHNNDGSDMNYGEFTPLYPEPLSCAEVTGSIFFRDPPQSNKHSCTQGVNNSIAMCISSLDVCTYDPGNEKSIVFEVTVTPAADTAVQLTGLSFFEQAPLTFNWIAGTSGPNNYPTLYGIRVLKNGVEIFSEESLPTSNDWTEQIFDFVDDIQFIVEEPTVFRFELLPYCLIGNGAMVAAWDLDEINVSASCVPFNFTPIIEGIVTTETGRAVTNVEISLSYDPAYSNSDITHTNQFGQYTFDDNEHGNDYYLRGKKNTDCNNGVSTLDLIQIQKHLLGIEALDSPYKMIAADANRSNTVSVIDLLELRKLILGYYSEFPNNTSWRFGNVVPGLDGNYPWGFKETIEIEALDQDIHDADFIGVKIGDVNGDALTNTLTSPIRPRSNTSLQLQMDDLSVENGKQFRMDIRSGNFTDIAGFQMALQLRGLKVERIISGKLELADENYNITSDGKILLSWNSSTVVSTLPNEVLFSLEVTPYLSGNLSDLVYLSNSSLQGEAYAGNELDLIDLELSIYNRANHSVENELFQNEPNPFSTNTTIRFQLEQPGIATICFYDLSGRLLKELNNHFERGMNVIEISNEELSLSEGVILCQLRSNKFVAVQRMVIIR